MREYHHPLKQGITRTHAFEEKRLAAFAINVGVKCGHDCLYCSSGAMLRMHPAFQHFQENPYGHGFSIVDPGTPERVARDARQKRTRGLIQLCTTSDAWAPEAQVHHLGRRCLDAVLAQPGWTVRILTKNAAVVRDYDVVERYSDRVLVGLSLTGTPEADPVLRVLEPNTSPIAERIPALQAAHAHGLRTYGMLCPLLPGVADAPEAIDQLVEVALVCGAEEVFAEPVNARGNALPVMQECLQAQGFSAQAEAIGRVRQKTAWSAYTAALLKHLQQAMARRRALPRLRFLLYPSTLTPADLRTIRRNPAGVVWLGQNHGVNP